MADVIAIIVLADAMSKRCGRCYCHWIMLIGGRWKANCGRCSNHLIGWLADVFAKVTDGKLYWGMADVIAIMADRLAT